MQFEELVNELNKNGLTERVFNQRDNQPSPHKNR